VPLLETGVFIDANGYEREIDQNTIDQMASTYDPDLHDAFIIPGHSSDPEFGVPSTDTAVSLGWIKSVISMPNTLLGDLEIHPKLYDWIQQKLFKYRSLAYYTADDPRNPTPGSPYIRHLAILGATPPAIKGMVNLLAFSDNVNAPDIVNVKQPLETEDLMDSLPYDPNAVPVANAMHKANAKHKANGDAKVPIYGQNNPALLTEDEDEDGVPFPEPVPDGLSGQELYDFLDANIPQLLKSVLTYGEKGYKGEITSFDPVPTKDNSYLYDAEESGFVGGFIDNSSDEEEKYSFKIFKTGDSYSASYTIKERNGETLTAEMATDETANGEELATELDNETPALGEYMASPATSYPEAATYNNGIMPMAQYPSKPDSALLYEIQIMKNQLKELEDMMIEKFMHQALNEGKLLGADEGQLRSFAEALYKTKSTKKPIIAFSEGEKQYDLFNGFMRILSSIPSLDRGLFTALSEGKPKLPDVAPPGPQGYVQDPEGMDDYRKIVKYAKENGLDINKQGDYTKAMKAVMKENQ
jgi:phage I-like protein